MRGLAPYKTLTHPIAHRTARHVALVLRRCHRIRQNILRLQRDRPRAVRQLWDTLTLPRGMHVISSDGDLPVPAQISHSTSDADMETHAPEKSQEKKDHLNRLERTRYHRLKHDPIYKAKRRLAKIDYTIRQLQKERQWILRDLREAVVRHVEQPVPSLCMPTTTTDAVCQGHLQMSSLQEQPIHLNDWELDLDVWESILDSLFPERHDGHNHLPDSAQLPVSEPTPTTPPK